MDRHDLRHVGPSGTCWVIVVIARRRNATPSAPTAQDILAERHARGEIDAEEYHRRLDDLRGDSSER
jgi:uncharacterized membrane protein